MRGKSLKWLSLIFLFVFILISVNVTATGSIVVFVDPPEIRDDTLQAGSDFTVGINISDASDVYGWQVRMTWDPSILEIKRDIGYEDEIDENVGHGNGTETVFQLDDTPVKENSETIYVFVTNESLGHGDNVTKTFWLDHTPVKEDSEAIYVPIIGENVGTGDGETTAFSLDYVPVRESSETIYVDGVPQTKYINYTMNYPSGDITFITIPADGTAITADYGWLNYTRNVDYTMNYTTGNVTFTVPPPTSTDLRVDYVWLNYTRNVDYTMNYTSGEVTFTVPPPNCTDIGADYTWWYNIYHVYEDDFLKGPFPHDSHPYYEATEPLLACTHTPNSSSIIVPGWNPFPPTLVMAVEDEIDNRYAASSTNNSEVEWGGLGFPTGSMSNVARLEVGVQSSTTESNTTEQDKIEIEVSNDGGTSWGPTHTVYVFVDKALWWVDVTDDFPWTPSMLTDANFKVRMRYRQAGAATTELRVWYLPVRVSDTLIVENPGSAYDGSFNTYASFLYSETRGNFTVYDFSHDFPSEATDPTQETSTIEQVDFNMKYWANASSTGSYKITYYVDPSSSETVLEDWKSTETTLGNYTWTNQTEPNNGAWDWTDVSNIKIVVETDSTGADPYAFFNEYEAWVTVTYTRLTSMTKRVKDVEGRATFSAVTSGSYPGIDGNGTLATVEFEVLGYGDTILNTTHTDTILFDSSTPIPQPIPFTPENGYFNNVIPGDIQGNTGGTPPDGDVDMFDFFAFADHYATVEGDPNYNILADLQGDTPQSYPYPDGDVDMFDFFAFADNYGKSI